MSLTGPITLLAAILFAAAMPVLAMLTWNRVGRGQSGRAAAGRWIWRGGLVLGSQLTAVALVAVLINNSAKFYTSWLELLGEHHTVTDSVAAAGNEDAQLRSRLAQATAHGLGIVVQIKVSGADAGIGRYPALVYLPAQYGLPEYAHREFPVVELVAGAPGTPQTWTDALAVAHNLDREIAAGRSLPFIAVMPSQDVAGHRDTQCVDIAGGPQVDRYLTTDIRTAVVRAFRANPQGRAWALMGYSSGGFCATNLAMRHPDLFAAAVSIAGYARPAHDHQTGDLFGGNAELRNENTPVWRATHLPPPDVALLLITTSQDPGTARDAHEMAAAARRPLSVTCLNLGHGGHNFEVWRAEEPVAFAWVSRQLIAPLAPQPVIDNTQPVVVVATH
ncbi:MAG: hypothetical protein QOG80_2538 [Pseudonocardiales bacterium]|nr:hypothetical protein [Pseudonocardiales bacterium]